MNSEAPRRRFEAFQTRDFSLFFSTRFMTVLATQMVDVSVAWLIYDTTGSALMLGFIGLCIFLPNIVFLLVAGHVADSFERRRVLIVCYSASMLATLGLLAAVWRGTPAPWLVFTLVALIGTARAFASPASSSILPNIVPREVFPNAVALTSSASQTAAIMGPAVGGLLYGFGAPVVFIVTATLYAIAVICLLVMKVRPAAALREKISWAYLTAGIKFIRHNSIVLGAITLDLFAVLLAGATALLPIFAKDIFQTDSFGLGVLRSAPAIGAVAMSLAIVHFDFRRKVGVRLFQSVAVFGLATICFGLAPSFWFAFGCLVALGAADMVSVYIRSALVQIETPDEMRGRVSAVNSMFIGASNELGQFEAGVVAHFTGAVMAVVLGGMGTLGVTVAGMKLFPALLQRDRLEKP
jgi:MFS family permease